VSSPEIPTGDQRRATADKILPVLDVIYALLGAVLAVFGRRKLDRD
jgi:hypothetical protein